ncbi:MAG: class I SAM-dependent rRNA methyltransferase, partial [Planctomycetota bacterium]
METSPWVPAGEPPATAWVRLAGTPSGPRIFRKQVAATAPGLRPGQRVAGLDKRGSLVGWGLFHPRSEIRVRLLRRGPDPADDAWLRERAAAAALRRLEDPLVAGSGDAWRVLHAEGDDFPGLTVDRLGEVLSAEAYTLGAVSLFETVLPVLHERLGTAHHRISFAAARARAEGERAFERRSQGCPRRVKIQEHGVRFEVDLEEGHKTGFFCDQRENRRRLAALARGRTVLDVCCYSGGFAIAAAIAGARSVLGIDLDESVLPQARRNANLNQERVAFVHADAFSYLRTLWRNGRRFDVIVLDPP